MEKSEAPVNDYEVSFLTKTEDAAERVVGFVGQHVAVGLKSPARRIMFSYPIKKETGGCFVFLSVRGEPENIKQLERDLKTNADVLRSIIIRLRTGKAGAVAATSAPKTRQAPSRPRPEASSPMPLSNEALERKIEEILQ